MIQAISAVPGQPADREHRADDCEREREHRVLELDEAREPGRERWERDRAQSGSFVLLTSVISPISIAGSIAFAMS